MAENWDVTQLKGLTEQEALDRLRTEGYNELPAARKSGVLGTLLEVLREPMFLLLIACGMIYLFLGETTDAVMLLGFVFVIIGITFYQERKTERALEALRDLSSPRALVVRDGVERRIVGREVARGDLLVLAEGDRVPADATLLHSSYMTVDESLLTGESVPVRKTAAPETTEMGRPGGDGLPFLFSGTLVVKGRGVARVLATGIHTEMGKIGKALQTIETEETPLSIQTGRLVRNFAMAGFFLCLLVVVVYGLTRGNWMDGILSGITLAMAMIPEEFPVVLSIFMALGAWRIAQKNVLTRRMPAIETLGAAEVLCVDKTGTLTQNRMTVARLAAGDKTFDALRGPAADFPEDFHELMEFCILASHVNPFDPMEKAFRQFGADHLSDTEHLHQDWELEREFALSEHLLAMSLVWRSTETGKHVIAAKGAPEAVADLCHFPQSRREELAAQVNLLAQDGLRVLAVAKSHLDTSRIPGDQHDFDFDFLGLVGLADPIRPTVPAAVRECYTAGIRVVMITGDYPATAQNIARQIGLVPHDEFISGPELDAMGDAELAERAKTVNIFARVVPEQKLRILMAVKASGSIAAMTGDGVNDAPALKAADIGIAMGGTGTDVAREAAALVLLDNDFSSIVHAVRLGRRIFDNLKKAIAFILAVHVPIAGLSLLPVLFKWPLVLLPVHVVFLEMIIDPACSVVFEVETEEPGTMNRPPRDRNEPLLSRRRLLLSLMQGLGVLAVVLCVFIVSRRSGADENTARTLTFATLIVANIGLIMVNRSWNRSLLKTLRTYNSAVWWVVGGALLFLGLVVYTPGLREVFHFSPLSAAEIVIALVAGISSILWFELMKRLGRAF
mgnify:CR=1 FL=1